MTAIPISLVPPPEIMRRALEVLAAEKGQPKSASDILAAISQDDVIAPPDLSHAVDILEAQGFVRRTDEPNSPEFRFAAATITDEGIIALKAWTTARLYVRATDEPPNPPAAPAVIPLARYPDRQITASFQARTFTAEDAAWWDTMQRQEERRIRAIDDRKWLEIEMSEAEGKWNFARGVIESGRSTALYSVADARKDLVLSSFRYWTALECLRDVDKLEQTKNRLQFWIIAVGGFIVGIIAAVAAIIPLMH